MAGTVWLIDDCPLTLRLTKVRLQPLGASVRAFPSGNAAIAAWMQAGSEPPVAILMDLNMPGPSGLESGQTLRDAGYLGLLLLHSASPPDDRKPITDSGFDGVLLKPATKNDLAGMLTAAAAKARRRPA